jgi:hypothetical protein
MSDDEMIARSVAFRGDAKDILCNVPPKFVNVPFFLYFDPEEDKVSRSAVFVDIWWHCVSAKTWEDEPISDSL